MLTYKMAFISNVWTPRVINRVVRDIVTSARLTKVENIRLIAAANRDITKVLRGVQGIRFTTDLTNCEIYRLYVDQSVIEQPNDPDPESVMPEGVFDFETIIVVPKPRDMSLVVDKDPYGGVYLPDRFQAIPSTIDQYRNAPKPVVEDEMQWQPWL